MDYALRINYLKKDMLIYELNIRGIPADESKTVDSLRASLRPILQLEKKNKSLSIPPYNLDFDLEKTYVHDTLKKIKNSIKTVAGESAKTKFERYQTHLVHLLNRIDRAPVEKLSAENVDTRAALLVDILSTLDNLEQVSRQDPNLSVMFEAAQLEDSDSDDSTTHESRPSVSTPKVQQQSSGKSQRVEKWGIKFTGDQKSMSVHGFLERVSELCVARNVSEKELFESAIDLFEGKALNWFRSNRSRFQNWRGLSELLCRHFEPPDYRARLFKEILERTQDPLESIVDYLSSMHALFRRYGSITDDVKLDIISRNLAPFYTTQLPIVNSLEELEEQCLRLEAKKYRAEHYVPPSRRRQGFVEPDFAFVSDIQDCLSSGHPTEDVQEVSHVQTSNPRSREVTCWNCQKTGHYNRDCPSPRKTHCYRCGTPNVTVRSCPKCTSSGNAPRGNR